MNIKDPKEQTNKKRAETIYIYKYFFLAILPDLSFVLHERSAKSLGATRRPVLSGGLLSCHFHQ